MGVVSHLPRFGSRDSFDDHMHNEVVELWGPRCARAGEGWGLNYNTRTRVTLRAYGLPPRPVIQALDEVRCGGRTHYHGSRASQSTYAMTSAATAIKPVRTEDVRVIGAAVAIMQDIPRVARRR